MSYFRGIISFRNGTSANKNAYAVSGPTCFNTSGVFGLASGIKVAIDIASPFISVPYSTGTYLQFSIKTGQSGFDQAFFGTFVDNGGQSGAQGLIEVDDGTGPKIYNVLDGYGVFTGSTTNLIVFCLVCGPPRLS